MKKYFLENSLDFSEKIEVFEQFLTLFKEKNAVMNLSAIRDDEGIILKHFIDSLMLSKFVDLKGKLLDIGTGGGFPGIPLKIAFGDEIDVTLLDSVGKKILATKEFCEKLGLTKIKQINARAEDLAQQKDFREQFDFVTSRAVAYFPTLLEYAMPFVKVGGYFLAYKLDNPEEILDGEKAIIELGGEIKKIERYKIGDDERKIIFIKKIKDTPKKYPRIHGEPKKKPII